MSPIVLVVYYGVSSRHSLVWLGVVDQVYFADMCSKSANYCFTTPDNNTGLLLLCEVALGEMNELTRADYYAEVWTLFLLSLTPFVVCSECGCATTTVSGFGFKGRGQGK